MARFATATLSGKMALYVPVDDPLAEAGAVVASNGSSAVKQRGASVVIILLEKRGFMISRSMQGTKYIERRLIEACRITKFDLRLSILRPAADPKLAVSDNDIMQLRKFINDGQALLSN